MGHNSQLVITICSYKDIQHSW